MLQVGGDLDLGEEPLGAEHGGELGLEDLDGDLAVVLEVVGEIDRRHAALAELALDAVAVGQGGLEGGARFCRGSSGRGGLLQSSPRRPAAWTARGRSGSDSYRRVRAATSTLPEPGDALHFPGPANVRDQWCNRTWQRGVTVRERRTMPSPSGVTTPETLPHVVRVHILGAGPVGLMLAALFQPMEGFSVHLHEKRREYTRTRMVQLRDYLVADSVASYCTDYIDGESVEALFDASELHEGLAFRQSIPPDLMALLRTWVRGFCPLNAIERSLSELIETRRSRPVRRMAGVVTAADAMAMLEPGDVLIDCTGKHSLLRDRLVPGDGAPGANTFRTRLEYAIMVTFLYDQAYECNEYCKYYKNIENPYYKFIPAVNRTFHDGGITHVTGIVNITDDDYEQMPWQFDGAVAARQLPRHRQVDGPVHHQGQPGNRRQDAGRPGDRADTDGAVPCPPRDQPAVASGRGRRPSLRPFTGVPGG